MTPHQSTREDKRITQSVKMGGKSKVSEDTLILMAVYPPFLLLVGPQKINTESIPVSNVAQILAPFSHTLESPTDS